MHLATAAPLALASVAQQRLADDSPEMQRLKVADLLKQARAAMQEGKWAEADANVARAEAFNVSFPLMYFGDTPKKARKDFDRMRPATAAGMSAQVPNAHAASAGSGSSSGTTLPSERFTPGTASSMSGNETATSRQPGATPHAPPTIGATSRGEITLNDAHAQARSLVVKGRAELARGNVAGASHWCEKAMQVNAKFDVDEDSPEKLVVDIQKAGGKVANGRIDTAASPAAPDRFPQQSPFARPMSNVPPPENNNDIPSLLTRDSFPGNTPSTIAPPGEYHSAQKEAELLTGPVASAAATPSAPLPPHRDESVPVALPAVAFASPATGTPSATSIPSAAQTPTAQASTSSIPVAASSAGNNEQQRAQSDGLLWASRRALAVGDTRRANEALAQAKSLQVQYKFHEDSPAKVEAAIARYTDLVQIKDKESDAYRRRYADLQMQQAEDLLRWRDFDEAERLTTEAKRRGVAYTPFE
ncbi:MAG TPA: hypothetical protein VHV77_05325, partial [Pirellulales bacterium]|nr:hypothetical protein [Pirellulales bacterium]